MKKQGKTKQERLPTQLFIPKPGNTINKEQLLIQLYGKNKEFQYRLQLNSDLGSVFYRERNFK